MHAEYSLDLFDFLSFQLAYIISRNYKQSIFITFEKYFSNVRQIMISKIVCIK